MAMDLAELVRAWYLRELGYLFSYKEAGLDPPGGSAVAAGVTGPPLEVWGRNKHAVQVTGWSAGVSIQMQSSIDGTTWVNLGTAIAADGITQLPDGLFGYIRAVVTGAPGASLNVRLTSWNV
jgi:hypothetical protein